MFTFLNTILDFIFPPSELELKLRSISRDELFKISPKATETEFPFIIAVLSYKNPLVRELIWQIKYKKNKHAIECAGYALYQTLPKLYSSAILIPIPISNKRRNERGFNQSELIVDEIIRLDKDNRYVANYDLLIRAKNIDKQTFKNRNERIENTKNIFNIVGNIDNNTQIIIIDDVTTTGSTLNEARNKLIEFGFTDVKALTVAH